MDPRRRCATTNAKVSSASMRHIRAQVRHRKAKRSLAFLAAVAAVLFLAQTGHFTLVRHFVCAHGELVHGKLAHGELAHGAGRHHDHHSAAAHRGGSKSAEVAASAGDQDDHDHCVAVVPPALVGEAALSAPPAVELRASPIAALESATLSARRWLLAPKTSPPAGV
jgi:hypothetical protein